ncbi:MAG: hypothetical protein IJI97_06615 [Clostridia bacterium]|jgi:hypothetical protein|nr:hypothetical protein [Clostridia bacterium]
MGITDRFRAQQAAREEAFRNPGGPDAGREIDEIAQEDPYGLREENAEEE